MAKFEQIAHNSPAYHAACDLRYRLLRKPIHMELREKDVEGEETQFHFVARDDDGSLLACVIFKPLTDTHIKLRQMAVETQAQGKGIGAQLVRYAETIAYQLGYRTVETSARNTATGFYEKLGYIIEGEPYTEVNLHTIKMVKTLDSNTPSLNK